MKINCPPPKRVTQTILSIQLVSEQGKEIDLGEMKCPICKKYFPVQQVSSEPPVEAAEA
jgi:hypothetical protein